MAPPDFESVYRLLTRYLGKRPRRGPFPLESALTWTALLRIQAGDGPAGDMLEIGVEFGTSAFLLLEATGPREHLTLVDLKKTDAWQAGMRGPYRDRSNVSFIEANSMSLEAEQLPANCRWIHVDGGHLYPQVANDLALASTRLADAGILVVDDFFEIRWPDVTRATLDHLAREQQLVPFLLVNRKLYCTTGETASSSYRRAFSAFVTDNRERIGGVRL